MPIDITKGYGIFVQFHDFFYVDQNSFLQSVDYGVLAELSGGRKAAAILGGLNILRDTKPLTFITWVYSPPVLCKAD